MNITTPEFPAVAPVLEAPELDAFFASQVEKWTQIGLSTEPIEPDNAIVAIEKYLAATEHPLPKKWYIAKSPQGAAIIAASLSGVNVTVDTDLSTYYQYSGYGNTEAGWLSLYDSAIQLGVDRCAEVLGLFEIAKYAATWTVLQDENVQSRVFGILCHRPTKLCVNAAHNLHCTDGPAVQFPDGFAEYYYDGVEYPGEWAAPGYLTAEIALGQENIEQRRVACELLGWEAVLTNLGAISLEKTEKGELLAVDHAVLGGKARFVRVVDPCGGRVFALGVNLKCKTVDEAIASTFGKTPAQYSPEVET